MFLKDSDYMKNDGVDCCVRYLILVKYSSHREGNHILVRYKDHSVSIKKERKNQKRPAVPQCSVIPTLFIVPRCCHRYGNANALDTS